MGRFARAIKSSDRIPELFRCLKNVKEYQSVITVFLGLKTLAYPHVFHDKAGRALTVYDFEDVTTLWAVWCADEYRIPSDAKTIIDAGANIGAFCLYALKSAPEAEIFALEPFPETHAKLKSTVEANALSSRIRCVPAALTGYRTTLHMDIDPSIKSHSRTTQTSGNAETLAVDGLGLDDVMERYHLSSIDYLKIDIEGGEVPFFAGVSKDTLRKVRKIGVECHSQDGQIKVWSRLEDFGFRLERVSRGTRNSGASTAEFVRQDG
jgi:FkbM family methyltransferase